MKHVHILDKKKTILAECADDERAIFVASVSIKMEYRTNEITIEKVEGVFDPNAETLCDGAKAYHVNTKLKGEV